MAQQTTSDLLKSFQVEVENSAVISNHFKTWLVSQMMTMATVAYKHGQKEGVNEERARLKKKRKAKKN